jgi:hypothetical protein
VRISYEPVLFEHSQHRSSPARAPLQYLILQVDKLSTDDHLIVLSHLLLSQLCLMVAALVITQKRQ